MNFKITTLSENNIAQGSKNLIGEHGLSFGLEEIGVGHCTGPNAFVALTNEFKGRVFLNTVGNVMEF